MENKTLCILGCGYVGEAVAREGLKRGMRVSALTRNPEKAQALLELGLEKVVVADLDSDDWHEELSANQDYVLNCVSSAGGGLDGYRKSYINGQSSALRSAAQGKVGTYVYTGATSVYPQTEGEVVTETDVGPELTDSGKLLLEAEQVIADGAVSANLGRWFVLRLGGIYGPGRHYLLDQLQRGDNKFPGSGDFIVNYIHRDDIVSAVFSCFEADESIQNRIYNLVDGYYPTKAEIVEWIAGKIGAEKPVFDPTMESMRMAGRKSSGGKMPNRRVSTELIRQELDWKPLYDDFMKGYSAFMNE